MIRRFVGLASIGFVLLASCSKTDESSIFDPTDFKLPDGDESVFDKNNIIDQASFEDTTGIEDQRVQDFLHRTPYKRPTFLETYQSNGVRAADAILRASRTYRINPLVFLVAAEGIQGLLSSIDYPFPPERVEYVFQCGCLQDENCLPELAGFDRQVDCLGRKLRKSLDDQNANGTTASNWGQDKTSTTLDGEKVTPANGATASVYDLVPNVLVGKPGGSWFFWTVWKQYSLGIDYGGPIGGPGGNYIGDACASDKSCGGYENAQCAQNYPDGLCTASCSGDCPTSPDQKPTTCIDFKSEGGFCLEHCNLGASACRKGYSCITLAKFGGTTGDSVCYPDSTTP